MPGDEEDTLAKFNVLTVCQKLFLSIVKSEPRVPAEFREIFSHVRGQMLVRPSRSFLSFVI